MPLLHSAGRLKKYKQGESSAGKPVTCLAKPPRLKQTLWMSSCVRKRWKKRKIKLCTDATLKKQPPSKRLVKQKLVPVGSLSLLRL